MNHDSDRESVLAAGRRVLRTIAAWTNFLFDGGAGTRLIEVPLPPDGVLPPDAVNPFRATMSSGRVVEQSIVLSNLGTASDFVHTGEWRSTLDELMVLENALEPFRVLIKSDAICGPYTDVLIDDADQKILLHVLEGLYARRWLAVGSPMTLPQLAVLAGLSEKTVRMAAIGRNKNPALMTYRDGAASMVAAEEAERWLRLRQDFKPTRIHGDVSASSLTPRSSEQLAHVLTTFREHVGLSVEQLARQLRWTTEETHLYTRLEEAWWTSEDVDVPLFDVPKLVSLARAFKIQAPFEFVNAVSGLLRHYEIERQLRMPENAT